MKYDKRQQKRNGGGVLFLSIALILIFLIGSPISLTTYAARSETDWVTIGEIYDEENLRFKDDELKKLYTYLTGEEKFSSVAKSAQSTKTSADFRDLNEGNNIALTFGGIKWDVVYLTTARNGNVILDLWQSSNWESNDITKQKSMYSNGWYENNEDQIYPCTMYSTSKIRVDALNAGGYYSSKNIRENLVFLEHHEQSEESIYARFTMDDASDSLTRYIVKPVDVAYQETEFNSVVSHGWVAGKDLYFPNDAYGTPQAGGEWSKDYLNFGLDGKDALREYEQAYYDAWKNDYLWLPSITETGYRYLPVSDPYTKEAPGMWNTDDSLRSATETISKNGCYLRSGTERSVSAVYALTTKGTYTNDPPNMERGLRPALHLNLTAAQRTIPFSPEKTIFADDTKTYSPNGTTWQLPNNVETNVIYSPVGESSSWWNGENCTITAFEVGKYQLTVRPRHNWSDGSNDTLTITFIVEKAKINVQWEEKEYTYTGEKLLFPIATAKGLGEDGDFILDVKMTSPANGEFKNVGEYDFEASFKSGEEKAKNYDLENNTRKYIVSKPVYDLTKIQFNDLSIKCDGQPKDIKIVGDLPDGVSVRYENNGQSDPGIYTITAIFSDSFGEIERKMATLTILRTHAKVRDKDNQIVFVESEEGFDPTYEIIVESFQEVNRTVWFWQKDNFVETYRVKILKDGVEVPFEGQLKIRLTLPEEFKNQNFDLSNGTNKIDYTIEGNSIIFSVNGLSDFILTQTYTPYLPFIIIASCVLFVDIVVLILLLKKKKRNR